ncbi:urease subunit alpha, partial [Streptomyces sp. NPDC058953]
MSAAPRGNGGIDPYEYASVHGPRAGDRVVLGDTGLVVRVESDSQHPGDEFRAGGGQTARARQPH